MKRFSLAGAAFLVLVCLGTGLVLAQVDRAGVEEVLGQVERIRGLQAPPDISVEYLSQDELRERMIQDFEEENPEEEIRTAAEIMVMLGLIEPDLDLYQLYIDLYTEQVAGFYDPEEKELFLISEDRSLSALDRYVLSHELTHYLQDRNFDLTRPPFHDPDEAEEETDDDASFAALCLVEGDAMITAEKWLQENATPSDLVEMRRESGEFSSEVLDSAPGYVRDGLLFPYEEGTSFVRRLYRSGGFRSIDQAFRDPPSSTEQIYHPEKYLAREDPVPVELPDMSGELGPDWELAYDNVLGEFDVYEFFMSSLGEDRAREAAAGWGGNKYHYYREAGGGKLLVQLYAWDSEEDASQFVSAVAADLEKRFRNRLKEEEGRGAWTAWSARDYHWALKKEGLEVYLLQATGRDVLEAAMAALGESGEDIGEELRESGEEEELRDYGWLVIAGVVPLLALGIVLVVVIFMLTRHPPYAPGWPPYAGHGPRHGGSYPGAPGGSPWYPPPPHGFVPPPGTPPPAGTAPPETTPPPSGQVGAGTVPQVPEVPQPGMPPGSSPGQWGEPPGEQG